MLHILDHPPALFLGSVSSFSTDGLATTSSSNLPEIFQKIARELGLGIWIGSSR